jgi:hypothetical protein
MPGSRLAFKAVVATAAFVAFSASSASAATFTLTPSPTTTNGAGPFTWSFHADAEPGSAYSWLAYKLSTEPYWHRCTQKEVVTIENLPIGTYSLEISDDINLDNFNSRGLYNSGFTQPCKESPPPESTFARRISTFSVIAPPALPVITPPTTPTTTPATPVPSPSPDPVAPARPSAPERPSCKKVKHERTKLIVAVRVAHRRLKHAITKAERARWRRYLAADKARLRALRCP